jgi:hypothetical protein
VKLNGNSNDADQDAFLPLTN